MSYSSLESCLIDLEKSGQLIRVKEEVDPYLEMAAIHLKVFEAGGPALLFEKVKGSRFRAASNIFGTLERSRFLFRDTVNIVEKLIELKNNPATIMKHPFRSLAAGFSALNSIPLKNPFFKPVLFEEVCIDELPLITHWPMDGGAFVTLPQVYSEDPEYPGIKHSNLGMYRIQLNGNDYTHNKEVGLHYQLHRGIGIHQTKANARNQPLKVSVFVGGPPSHTVSAVMPLPEGMSEMNFAGVLGNRRFRYVYKDDFCISTDADFVITGTVMPSDLKPEGPFGDHLGYYSLKHLFPVMKIHKVFAKKNAIWPFTVVGRPPQEDTSFGALIHSLTGNAIKHELPGVREIHAVDAAGVHPLLLAIGSERYTPYMPAQQPAELLTIANRILGTGQLSLAKFLFITTDDENIISTKNIKDFFCHLLSRIDLNRDVHFHTNTTIDTLDYSGTSLNSGSKVVFAAHGAIKRKLSEKVPEELASVKKILDAKMILPGILAVQINAFSSYEQAESDIHDLNETSRHVFKSDPAAGEIAMMILCDDAEMTASTINNFLWVSFTRCNPSHDIYGIDSFVKNKHWGCEGPLIIDARIKPHHAPPVMKDPETEKKIERIFNRGGSLYGVLK